MPVTKVRPERGAVKARVWLSEAQDPAHLACAGYEIDPEEGFGAFWVSDGSALVSLFGDKELDSGDPMEMARRLHALLGEFLDKGKKLK